MDHGHDVLCNYIRSAGAYLVENAEDLVGNSPYLHHINISIDVYWPDDQYGIMNFNKEYFVNPYKEPENKSISIKEVILDGRKSICFTPNEE